MTDPLTDNASDEEPKPNRIERWVMPYLRDSGLWPILFAFLGITATFLSVPLLYSVRDRNLVAMAGVAFLIGGPTAALIRYERRTTGRVGAVSKVLIGTWIAAAVLAGLAGAFDLW